MAANPNGAVLLDDGGVPRIFTAKAREDITAGVFVFCSGAQNVVTSGAASFAFGDIEVAGHASGGRVNGIAIRTQTSGLDLGVATKGRFLVSAGGTIVAGDKCDVDGSDAVIATVNYAGAVGRALTSAASGGFVIFDLQC